MEFRHSHNPWHIQNPGIFRSLTVFMSLSFGNCFRPQLFFPKRFFLDHFRCLTGFWIPLSICKYYVTCKVILGSISGIFTHIFKHYSRGYSYKRRTFSILGISRTLTYLKVRRYLDPCQIYCNVFGK